MLAHLFAKGLIDQIIKDKPDITVSDLFKLACKILEPGNQATYISTMTLCEKRLQKARAPPKEFPDPKTGTLRLEFSESKSTKSTIVLELQPQDLGLIVFESSSLIASIDSILKAYADEKFATVEFAGVEVDVNAKGTRFTGGAFDMTLANRQCHKAFGLASKFIKQ